MSLTCHAPTEPGNPAASWLTWRKQNSDFSRNKMTGVLSVTPSRVGESGKFSCEVSPSHRLAAPQVGCKKTIKAMTIRFHCLNKYPGHKYVVILAYIYKNTIMLYPYINK